MSHVLRHHLLAPYGFGDISNRDSLLWEITHYHDPIPGKQLIRFDAKLLTSDLEHHLPGFAGCQEDCISSLMGEATGESACIPRAAIRIYEGHADLLNRNAQLFRCHLPNDSADAFTEVDAADEDIDAAV
jgi:hypothetical protein